MGQFIFIAGTDLIDEERRDEFHAWYNSVHLPDMMGVTGFVAASRYEGVDLDEEKYSVKETDPEFLAIYSIETEDIDQAIRDMKANTAKWQEQGRMYPFYSKVSGTIYRQIAASVDKMIDGKPIGLVVSKTKWLFMAKSDCTDSSRLKEFQDWYDTVHVPDMIRTLGIVRATRYELVSTSRFDNVKETVPSFMVLYEIASDNIQETIDSIKSNIQVAIKQDRITPLFKAGGARIYKQITPQVT